MGNEKKPPAGAIQHIDTSAWLADTELVRLIDVLETVGSMRFVGGAVRDSLLGLPHNDIDLASTALPDASLDVAMRAGFRMVPTGIAHGTVTAVLSRGPVEITTLRRDVATDGRHATVAFTDDWAIDAGRRDFTVNALSATRDGAVFDYFGGLGDLAARRVRFIGDASSRICEDYLRVFRLFRFSGRFADTLDADALEAVRGNLSGIRGLSGERVALEVLKLLAGPNAALMWRGMIDCGLIAACLPKAVNTGRLERLAAIEDGLGLNDGLRRLRATLPDDTLWLRAVGQRLKLSTVQRKRLAGPTDPAQLAGLLASGNYAEALYRNDRQVVIDSALMAAASGLFPSGELPRLLGDMLLWAKPVFPLGGDNLMELGLKPGPIFGALLREVEEWWIGQGFKPTRQECFAELKRAWQARKRA